jgi:hypothetical protein
MVEDKRWAVMHRRRGEQKLYPYTSLMTWKSAVQLAQQYNERYGVDHVFTVEDYYDRYLASIELLRQQGKLGTP